MDKYFHTKNTPFLIFPKGRAERLKIAQWAILATEPACRGDLPLQGIAISWDGGIYNKEEEIK